MHSPRSSLARPLLALPAVAALAGAARAQSFEKSNLLIEGNQAPWNASSTENVDFADVDLDGDWDAVMADGGDDGNDQNRIWINQGGLQAGVLGEFSDQTDALLPAIADDSRDIEFADIENDGDQDLYISNTAQIVNQGNHWWVNQGGLQGGSAGAYVDDTASRWVGLNSANSSIFPALLLPDAVAPETFIDWSCDCDFGDLDNDGDMDLVHSSYGGAFGGGVPTRLFLNDGDGFFEEFNPSGHQLTGVNIPGNAPGLWCEGTQQADTALADGTRCDIASSALDVDLGDTDGDFDLDLLHGARQEAPRFFENRLEENGGVLGWRDVTAAVFPPGWSSGNGHYEQEMGDLDSDGDLDIYGLNWLTAFSFDDIVLENDGSGVFGNLAVLPGSQADDNEGDFIDYDNDGDMDLIVANFSGANKLYRNSNNGGGSGFAFTLAPELPIVVNRVSLDADVCDWDEDGDYDFLEANDNFAPNRFFVNTTQAPDVTAADVPHLEAVSGHAASATDDVVRAHVYDNAPYYITWFNETLLHVSVDGIELPAQAMFSAGGQIFRGTLAGNLVGDVDYHVTSADRMGNVGSSATASYSNTGATGTLQGGSTPGPLGTPTLRSLVEPSAGQPLHVVAGNATPGAGGVFLFSAAGVIPGGLPLGDGAVLNVLPPFLGGLVAGSADANGDFLISVEETGPVFSGLTLHCQALFLDGAAGSTWSSTQSLTLAFP